MSIQTVVDGFLKAASAQAGGDIEGARVAQRALDLGLKKTYRMADHASLATAPLVVGPAIPAIRLIAIKALEAGANVVAVITTADGAAQVFPVTGIFLWHVPTGNPATALSITGTGPVAYVVAGD